MKNSHKIHDTLQIPESCTGMRLDQALAQLWPQFSRMRIKEWIESGQITVNQQTARPKDKLQGEEHIEINAVLEDQTDHKPQEIPLDIVYEDDEILVVNKPAGLVVHPGAGNPESTLLNALLFHEPNLVKLPRAGIIHRIDKETSGLLVIAKTITAHHRLVDDLKAHKIQREYEAIVIGALTGGATINQPLGRHPHQRIKMAIVESGKPATTHYRIIERFQHFTHIKVILETGRTHQIRVHMAAIHHPLIGDPLYGGGLKLPKGASKKLIDALQNFKRQALHAKKLTLIHPSTEETMVFRAKRPGDLDILLAVLKEED